MVVPSQPSNAAAYGVVARGKDSVLEAYKVGAYIEEYDILDIKEAIDNTSHGDIENVYENLVRGSRNHLRSFVGQIEAAGEIYEPVLLSVTDYVRILNNDQETANGRGTGRTGGQDSGNRFESTVDAVDQLFSGSGRRSGRGR